MTDRAKTDKSTKRDQILRCGKDTAAIVHARAKERGIGIYQAAEELIAIGQKRVDALATYAGKRKKSGRSESRVPIGAVLHGVG